MVAAAKTKHARMPLCSIRDCANRAHAIGLCVKHYGRSRAGLPMMDGRPAREPGVSIAIRVPESRAEYLSKLSKKLGFPTRYVMLQKLLLSWEPPKGWKYEDPAIVSTHVDNQE